LLPLPQPSEISIGYIGRIRILNRLEDHKTTILTLRNHHRHTSVPGDQTCRDEAHVLAVTAGLSVSQYMQAHTMAPFWDGLSANSSKVSRHGRQYNANRCSPRRLLSARTGAAFCPKCVIEQRDSLGFTYWRREWQIPGIESCFRDGIPLVTAPKAEAFASPPEVLLAQAHDGERLAIESEGIAFYRSASTLLLGRAYPIQTTLLDVARQQHIQWLRQHRVNAGSGPWEDTCSPLFIPRAWIIKHRQDLGFFSSYGMLYRDRFLDEISTGWKILLLSIIFTSFREFRLLLDTATPRSAPDPT
jgi:hypothetical protein